MTRVGNRVRLGLAAPQPLAAEITLRPPRRLRLRAGVRVMASWKAAAHAAASDASTPGRATAARR